jgi:tetratricopeptide (TPR) repeat protein
MTGKTRKQQIQEMLADDPRDPFLHYGLAMEYVGEGAAEEAVRCFRQLFAVAPDYVPAYLQAGLALLRLGRPEEAREVWARGVAVAREQGDRHAQEEMQGFLAGLG